jgi:hypothetical protein
VCGCVCVCVCYFRKCELFGLHEIMSEWPVNGVYRRGEVERHCERAVRIHQNYVHDGLCVFVMLRHSTDGYQVQVN